MPTLLPSTGPEPATGPAFERHYRTSELAALWSMDPTTIRDVFRDQPGVLKLGKKTRGLREYHTLYIPESVARRVHEKLSR